MSSRSKTLRRFFSIKKKEKKTEQPVGADSCKSTAASPQQQQQEHGVDLHHIDPTLPSIYHTVPKAKKDQLSRSESDLRKSRPFGTFSLGWKKKKKKNRDLSQSTISISTESEFEPRVISQQQTAVSQPVLCAIMGPDATTLPLTSTDLSTDQLMLHPATGGAGEVFMPVVLDSSPISYIDSSLSDNEGYHTPPESPMLIVSTAGLSLTTPYLEDTQQSISSSTGAPETNSKVLTTPVPGVSETLITTGDFTAQTHRTAPPGPPHETEAALTLSDSVLTRVSNSIQDIPDCSGLDPKSELICAVEGQYVPNVTSPTSTDCSVNSSVMSTQHTKNSAAAAESWAQSATLQNVEQKELVSLEMPTSTNVTGSITPSEKADSSSVSPVESSCVYTISPHSGLTQGSSSFTDQMSSQFFDTITTHTNLLPTANDTTLPNTEKPYGHVYHQRVDSDNNVQVPRVAPSNFTSLLLSTTETSNNTENKPDQNTSPNPAAPPSLDVSDDSVPKAGSLLPLKSLDNPVIPQLSSSATGCPGLFSEVSVRSVDAAITSLQFHPLDMVCSGEAVPPILGRPVCHGSDPVQLQHESNTFSPPTPTSSIFKPKTDTLDLLASSQTVPSNSNCLSSDVTLILTHMSSSSDLNAPVLKETVSGDLSSETLKEVALTNFSTDTVKFASPDQLTFHMASTTNQHDKGRSAQTVVDWSEQTRSENTDHDNGWMDNVILGTFPQSLEAVNKSGTKPNPSGSVRVRFTPQGGSKDENSPKVDLSEGGDVLNSKMGENIVETQQTPKIEGIQVLGSVDMAEKRTGGAEEKRGLQLVLYNEQHEIGVDDSVSREWSDRESEMCIGKAEQINRELDVLVSLASSPEECATASPCSPHEGMSVSHQGAEYSPTLPTDCHSALREVGGGVGGGVQAKSLFTLREDDNIHKPVTHTTTYQALKDFHYLGEKDLHRFDSTETQGSHNSATYNLVTLNTLYKVSSLSSINPQEALQNSPEAEEEEPDTHSDFVYSHTEHRREADPSDGSTSRSNSATGIIVYIREFGSADRKREKDDKAVDHTSNVALASRLSNALPVLNAVEEDSNAESATNTEMSSSIGVLSTTLKLRPKVTQDIQDDSKRVHKVSLVTSSSSLGVEKENGLNGGVSEWKSNHEVLRTTAEDVEPSNPKMLSTELPGNSYLFSALSTEQSEATAYSSSSYLSFSPGRHNVSPPTVALDTSNSQWSMRSEVHLSGDGEAGGKSWEELSAPAGRRETERDRGIENTGWDSLTRLEISEQEPDEFYSGIFKATRVELPASPTNTDTTTPLAPAPAPALAPASPASPHEMDTLLETLKNMGPPVRNRSLRNQVGQHYSSLPAIIEDATGPPTTPFASSTSPATSPESLPMDLGLTWSSVRSTRSPLDMMKEQKGSDLFHRTVVLPSRSSSLSNLVMCKSSLTDMSSDEGAQVNGSSLFGSSRLEHSLLFSSYRTEQQLQGDNAEKIPLFRSSSLPEIGSTTDRLSLPTGGMDSQDSQTSPNSLTGLSESSHTSVASSLLHSPTATSPTPSFTPPFAPESGRILSPESPSRHPAPPSLQQTLSSDLFIGGSPVHNEVGQGFGFGYRPGLERNAVPKYRAFPDGYLTKEKEHGKVNPRPGKMYIYDQPGLCGRKIEVRGDVVDATAWQFPETISIRVVRGGWVLYEKPDFKGEKIALDEGDIELTLPFAPLEEQSSPPLNGTDEQQLENNNVQQQQNMPARSCTIGSLRRAVRDYSVPEICLFPEEKAEGKKVVFRDTSEDARIFGFPIRANSIIINAGLWLVFAEPFFQGVPRVLEVGGFPNPASWGVTQPYIASLHPLKIGEPKVEKPNEPKLVIYEKSYFTGKSCEIYTNTRDFISREDRHQSVFMYSASSLKVVGGIWVGYEKEGFRGHQYLLEEGEYHDWRVWGGCDAELRSVRLIRTDLSCPALVLYEMALEEEEEAKEERTFEVMEAVPDVELFGFRPATHAIHVLSGAWVAYSHVDYSGKQYILEKGFYNNCADWGSDDNRICSLQPILQAPADGPAFRSKLFLYSEPSFQGTCHVYSRRQEVLDEALIVRSCRVVGSSWVLYESTDFMGNQYVLSEGDYPSETSMGSPLHCPLRSAKPVPLLFAVPSISLFGLECFEGREVTFQTEVFNMAEDGINPHFLSVKVNSGCWVLFEYSNYRGRQFLLEPIEITNWHKFSSLSSVGSIYPVQAKRCLFRIRYKPTGLYMSVQSGVDGIKTGRVVVSQQVEPMSDVWFYQDGLIKNKLEQEMSLQVMGNVESGAKVVLRSESRTPVQKWEAELDGCISSLTFPGLVLDVKGGKVYDKEHVVVRSGTEESPGQLWELELI